jgi:hypothetical protein
MHSGRVDQEACVRTDRDAESGRRKHQNGDARTLSQSRNSPEAPVSGRALIRGRRLPRAHRDVRPAQEARVCAHWQKRPDARAEARAYCRRDNQRASVRSGAEGPVHLHTMEASPGGSRTHAVTEMPPGGYKKGTAPCCDRGLTAQLPRTHRAREKGGVVEGAGGFRTQTSKKRRMCAPHPHENRVASGYENGSSCS